MNKKEALIFLIKNSVLFTDNTKMKMLGKLDLLTPEETDSLGKFFALQAKYQIEKGPEIIAKLDKLENQLQKIENNSQKSL